MTLRLDAAGQLDSLAALPHDFLGSLEASALIEDGAFKARRVKTLQVNITYKCNQTCKHCHVDAGPSRKEQMSDEIIDRLIELCSGGQFATLDITGGAPEMHPRFEDLIEAGSRAGMQVIHRCNLTAVQTPRYSHLPAKFAGLKTEIVASLPYFRKGQTDLQRGDGVFEKSIRTLQQLGELGYGVPGSGLVLNLVTNPVGAWLPGSQVELENLWRAKLKNGFGIEFNNLFTITNMPVARFLEFLVQSGQYEEYMQKLVEAYNPAAAAEVMCRDMISVGWDGTLYDCDFNQMLELPVQDAQAPKNILDAGIEKLSGRSIALANHCYGCTAGSGSSCGGSLD